jgi:predicted RNase H-like HicB family nuclease
MAVISKEEKWYVANCVELGVVSQGKTIEEAKANLQEAVKLYLESFGSEDLTEDREVPSSWRVPKGRRPAFPGGR